MFFASWMRKKFSCDEILDYEYSVFDVSTELLESQGGKPKRDMDGEDLAIQGVKKQQLPEQL